MNRLEHTTLVSLYTRELEKLAKNKPACTNCERWGGRLGCTLVNETPPEEVILVGCDEWTFDDIPF